MLEPEEVSAIMRLNELGWGAKRISRELGISRNTVRGYIAAGGWTPYRQPRRKKALDGQEAWLRERLRRHRGNADVIRQELAAEMGIIVSLRTVERAVQPYRQSTPFSNSRKSSARVPSVSDDDAQNWRCRWGRVAEIWGADQKVVASRLCAFEAHRGTAFIKKRININALKLRENFSRLACHCDALVFLFGIRIRVRLAN